MQRYSGQALLKFDDPATGNTTGVVGVTVRDHTTQNLATLFSDDGVTSRSNPFNSNADGTFDFYTANGNYDVIIEEGSGSESKQFDVQFFDEQDFLADDVVFTGTVSVPSPSAPGHAVNLGYLTNTEPLKAMTAADFNALAEKRKRDALGSGVVEWGKHHDTLVNINEGIWENTVQVNSLFLGRALSQTNSGISRTGEPLILTNGVVQSIKYSNNSFEENRILFPPAPDGLDKADGTGRFADLAEAITAGGTELSASVINRQDFCFLEVWHEKISDKDIVVPLGNVQYGATDWNGISLVGLNTLGVGQGYSAFGEWDTTTQGNGVRWSTLSDADKAKFVSDPENNIYLEEDGDLVQVRYRIRAVKGLEGDWVREGIHYISTNGQFIKEQGGSDIVAGFAGIQAFNTVDGDVGILQSSVSYQVPICLVSRHNTGVYSPEYNSRGADKQTGNQFWYQDPTVINSTADCFANTHGGGDIASTVSGRGDGEYYDAIYAKYVQDIRKASWEMPDDEVREECKRKAIAGQANFTPTMWEKAPFTKVYTRTEPPLHQNEGTLLYFPAGTLQAYYGFIGRDDNGQNIFIGSRTSGKSYEMSSISTNATGDFCYLRPMYGDVTSEFTELNEHCVWDFHSEQRAAEHTWTDIIGDPARIAATFPDGVQGQWIPVVPDGVLQYKDMPLNRKSSDTSTLEAPYTDDDGATWLDGNIAFDTTLNAPSSTLVFPTNRVQLASYTTPAHFTEDRVNAKVESLGGVESHARSERDRGSLQTSSLIGKVSTMTSSSDIVSRYTTKLNTVGVDPTTLLLSGYSGGSLCTHPTIALGQSNNSPAVKTLDYLTENNGVLDLQYAYKEMIYDTTWGDNNKFEIIDNQSTLTDDNGNTVLYGTAGFETAYFAKTHRKS